MRRLLAMLASAVALAACSHVVGGQPSTGPRNVDPAYFFDGDIPVYGQTVGSADTAVLAYLRALRRVDICGLVNRDVTSKAGELNSFGTLFAFNECDFDLKVSGASARKFVAAELMLTRHPGDAVAFRAGGTPIYASVPDDCVYSVPLPLPSLPRAPRTPLEPIVKIGLIAGQDCALAQRIAGAVAQRVTTRPLPARDALAAYPAALGERDPCQVLSVVGADLDHWDIGAQQPDDCRFSIRRAGGQGALPLRVQLGPQLVDAATNGLERREQDGVEIYVDHTFCSALSFVGAPMQRRLTGGGFVPADDLVIRPAITVDIGGNNCEEAARLAARAAKLYA